MMKLATAVLGLSVTVAPALRAERLTVETKSFIGLVALDDPSQFDDGKRCSETVTALAIDCAMRLGEDPKTGSASTNDFRMRSALTVDATCAGGKLSSWQFRPMEVNAGPEMRVLQTTAELSSPLKAAPAASGTGPTAQVDFSYRVRGKPNMVAAFAMRMTKPRACDYIWHQVDGRLFCRGNVPAVDYKVAGSAFPSVRSWLAGKQASERLQGPFKSLWVCSPSDPTSVL